VQRNKNQFKSICVSTINGRVYKRHGSKKEVKSPSLENFVIRNMSHIGTERVHGPFDLEDLCNGAMIISALTLHCFTVLNSLALRSIT